MPSNITEATPIVMLTIGQLEDFIRMWVRSEVGSAKAAQPSPGREKVHKLAGLAKLLGCSRGYACKINRSGIIDAATTRQGKLLIYDADMVLALLKEHKESQSQRRKAR